jgi:hypothetical protein
MPVPVKLEDWTRYLKQKRTIIDYVEDIHRILMSGDLRDEYRPWLDAIWDDEAIEGKCSLDSAEAAKMIRSYAYENNIADVAHAKLAVIIKSLNTVLHRYRVSREDRRNAVHKANSDGHVESPVAEDGDEQE